MQSAESFSPEELKGKPVAFVSGEDHSGCWHARVGLQKGIVLKPAQTLAEKMELLGPDDEMPEDLIEEEEVPKVWVKIEPCELFPSGCEAVVDLDCLLVLEPGEAISD